MPPPLPKQGRVAEEPSSGNEPSVKRRKVTFNLPPLVDVTYFGPPQDPYWSKNLPVRTLDFTQSVNHQYAEFALRIQDSKGGKLDPKLAVVEGRYAKKIDVDEMPCLYLPGDYTRILRFDKIGQSSVYMLRLPWHFAIYYEEKSQPIMIPTVLKHTDPKNGLDYQLDMDSSQFRFFGKLTSDPLFGGSVVTVTFENLTPKRVETLHSVAMKRAQDVQRMRTFSAAEHKQAKACLQSLRVRADDEHECRIFQVPCKTLLKHVIFDALCMYSKDGKPMIEVPSDPSAPMNDQERELTHYVYLRIMQKNKTTYDFWEKLMNYREAIKEFYEHVATPWLGRYAEDHVCESMSKYCAQEGGWGRLTFPPPFVAELEGAPVFFLNIPQDLERYSRFEREYLQKLQGVYCLNMQNPAEFTFCRVLPVAVQDNSASIRFRTETGTLVFPPVPRRMHPYVELGSSVLPWKLAFQDGVSLQLESSVVRLRFKGVKYFRACDMLTQQLWGPSEISPKDRMNRFYVMHKSAFQDGDEGCSCKMHPCQCSYCLSMTQFLQSIFLHAAAAVISKQTITQSEKQVYLRRILSSLKHEFGAAHMDSWNFAGSNKHAFELMFDDFTKDFNIKVIEDPQPAAAAP